MSDETKRGFMGFPSYILEDLNNARKILGAYKFGRMLANPSMSFVYHAERDGKEYAIKLPRSKNEEHIESIGVEAEALRMVGNHDNIVKLEHLVVGDPPYLALEFLPGNTIQEYYSSDDKSYRTRYAFSFIKAAKELALALDRVHEKGVLHRDVKPQNAISTNCGVKLIDFGIAKLPDGHPLNSDDPGLSIGTVGFMPYEQFFDPLNIGPQADIYALGRTLTYLLVGLPIHTTTFGFKVRDALDASKAMEAIEKQGTPPAHLNPQITPKWSRWLSKAVESEPEHRFQSASEFADVLDTILLEAGKRMTHLDLPQEYRMMHFPTSTEPDKNLQEVKKEGEHTLWHKLVLGESSDPHSTNPEPTWREPEEPGELIATTAFATYRF